MPSEREYKEAFEVVDRLVADGGDYYAELAKTYQAQEAQKLKTSEQINSLFRGGLNGPENSI